MPSRALVWFKRDLRLADHAPLAAAAACDEALALYVVEPEWLASPEFDPQHLAFALACLEPLRDALALRGLPLLVRHGLSQTAAHLVDRVIPHVPVRQWVLSLPIPLRLLLAAQPELVTPVLQVVQRLVTWHVLDAAGLKADEGQVGAVTLIQRFGSAANLNIHLHCLVLDGVYRRAADGSPAFIEAASPTDDELHALLQSVIERRGW
ncbi:MAG: deoxyribodipyrimidine photo-lyase [Pseudomonadota bacterium]